MSEIPVHSRPRRLVDWINPTGARKVHSLIDKVYQRKNLEMAWEKVKANRGSGGVDGQSLEGFAAQLDQQLWRPDRRHGHPGSPAAPLDDRQHPWRELSAEGPEASRLTDASGRSAARRHRAGRRPERSAPGEGTEMSFLRHGQIYQSDGLANRGQRSPAVPAIVSMSLRPAIPWQVGLHQRPPPLRQLLSMFKKVAVGVNHRRMRGGEFSTGETRNSPPALTKTGGAATKSASPALIGMSLRQDIPGGLLSSRVRFRFSCQDHSETEESRCQEKCSEWRSVPFGRVSKLDTMHLYFGTCPEIKGPSRLTHSIRAGPPAEPG
jgi:hypothetical protein